MTSVAGLMSSSGLYSVTTRGTDVNLDPCDDINPATEVISPPTQCANLPTSMGRNSAGLWGMAIPGNYSFPLSFAACGTACAAPPAIANSQYDASTCANQFDGYNCAFRCAGGYTPVGTLI